MQTLKGAAMLLFAFLALVRADSPITSTDFARAYLDVAMVKRADKTRVLDREIADYLSDPEVAIDCKAAVINALSWDLDGKHNAELFKYHLALKHQRTLDRLETGDLTADEVFCLGYLTVMDDYFDPAPALPLLEEARRRIPKSFTVAIIGALAQAQKLMDSDWDEVWKVTERVLEDKSLKSDLRSKARQIIIDYMILYKEDAE